MAKPIRSVMPGQIGEHHERVVEGVVLGVGARQLGRPVGVNGPEHVVIGEEVVKAQVLDRSPDPPNGGRVPSKLVLWVDDSDLHGRQPATDSVPIDAKARAYAALRVCCSIVI